MCPSYEKVNSEEKVAVAVAATVKTKFASASRGEGSTSTPATESLPEAAPSTNVAEGRERARMETEAPTNGVAGDVNSEVRSEV